MCDFETGKITQMSSEHIEEYIFSDNEKCWFWSNNEGLHRDSLPAEIVFYHSRPGRFIITLNWCLNGVCQKGQLISCNGGIDSNTVTAFIDENGVRVSCIKFNSDEEASDWAKQIVEQYKQIK